MWGQGMILLANVFVWFQSILVTCLSAGHGRESPILKEDVTERKSFNFCGKLKTSHFYPLLILFNFQQCLSNCCPIFRPSQEWERTQFSRKETTLSAETLKPTLSPFRWYTGWLCNPPFLTEQSTKNRARLSCHRYMYYTISFCKFDQIELGSWMTLSVKI